MRKTVPIDWQYKVHGHRIAGWVILAYSANSWHDVEEGPFDDFEAARDFAESEVGVPWVVVPIAKEYSALQGPPSDPRVLRQARTRTEDPCGGGRCRPRVAAPSRFGDNGGPSPEDVWSKAARRRLVGRKIVDAWYIDSKDAQARYWDARGLILQLGDNTLLLPMRDDEGNGPGALELNDIDTGEYVVLPVLQLDPIGPRRIR